MIIIILRRFISTAKIPSKLMIGRCVVSFIFVFFAQFALALVPLFLPSFSLLTHLPLSVLVLVAIAGLGRWCRRLLGISASAPAMVFFNVLFIWGVYIAVVRQAISTVVDILFNGEIAMLIFGLCRIISSDPGLVSNESHCLDELVERSVPEVGPQFEPVKFAEPLMNSSVSFRRIRYCRSCKTYIKGFDHHCPAFASCIGQNNYLLFIVLLIGFVTVEATYIACSSQFLTESRVTDEVGWEHSVKLQTNLSGNLAMSTMTFSLLQVLWQVVFMAWHVYCVCYNIKTDEWINWKKYPEFQCNIQSQPDQTFFEIRFMNPYNKGIISNLKEFLAPKGIRRFPSSNQLSMCLTTWKTSCLVCEYGRATLGHRERDDTGRQ